MMTALHCQPDPRPERRSTPDLAVENWLREALHQTYDTPAQPPIPEELLILIREIGRP